MSRPLLISDCDEVLLHMVGHFKDWLAEEHALDFALERPHFHEAITDRASGRPLEAERIWPLLDSFFDTEMHRQNLVPGALEALGTVGERADIIILTNLGDCHHAGRIEQLERFGIRHRVRCNRGGKGPPVAELVAEMGANATVFVDDLAIHHKSVAEHASQVARLHMIAEPRVAAHVPPAADAHARIDQWDAALPWILERLAA